MTEPQTRIGGVRQQYCTVDDADETTLVANVATDLTYAEVWAVTRAGVTRKIGRTPPEVTKVDSAGAEYFDDGTVRLWASAADPGAGGATCHTVFFDFPREVQPSTPAMGGGATFTEAPGGSLRIFAQANVQGAQSIALTPLGIPAAQSLSVLLTVSAPAAGRAGFVQGLKAITQAVGVRNSAAATVAPGPDNTLDINTSGGMLSEMHIDILGWTT